METEIVIDSGINSTNVTEIDESLIETQFIIEMDNRLGQLMSDDGKTFPNPVVDDDNVAVYTLTKTPTDPFVKTPSQEDLGDFSTPIDGPISTRLSFKIRSSQDLRVSNFLFDRIGSSTSTNALFRDIQGNNETTKFIDSIIRVTGRTTGYAIDIPVRYVKV